MSEHLNAPARLLQHRSSPVTFDPPTDESVTRALRDRDAQREEIARHVALRDYDKLELSRMVDIHGWAQVSDWLMGIQRIHNDLRRG